MTQAARRRMRAIVRAAVLATATLLVVTSCSDGHTDVRSIPAAGWPSYGGDAGNTNYSFATVPQHTEALWTRQTDGKIVSQASLNGNGDPIVSADTPNGCNFSVFDHRAGRKNFCKRMAKGFSTNTALVDQFTQPYIGEPGRFLAFTGGGAIRWRDEVNGVPTSAKFLAPERVLMVTSLGQVSIYNSQTGDAAAKTVQLWKRPPAEDPSTGMADCFTGGPGCAISAPPAVDGPHQRFFLNFLPEGQKASQLKAMSSADDTIVEKWTAPIDGGMVGPATASVDGKTVYAFSRKNKLYAFDAATGKQRWSTDVRDSGFATLTVSPDGVIVPAGKADGGLTVLRDKGDSVETVVDDPAMKTAGRSTLTRGGALWTVTRTADGVGLELASVDAATGKVTRTLPMPGATGFSTGVSIGSRGQIAVATTDGNVYYYGVPAS